MSIIPAELSSLAIFALCFKGGLGFSFPSTDLSREKSKAVLESPLKNMSPSGELAVCLAGIQKSVFDPYLGYTIQRCIYPNLWSQRPVCRGLGGRELSPIERG